MTTSNGVGPGMRAAPWQRLLGMALGLVVMAGVAVPAAAQQPGVTVSATMLGPLTEGVPSTASATYTVVLNAAPTGAVMLTVTSNNAAVAVDTDLTPRTRELTFTTMNWATAQPVTATATADLNAVDERVTLTHTLTGASEYMSVTVASVTVQVTDDEDPDLTLSVSNLAVTEETSTAYTVRLATQPAGDVAVEVRSDNADVALQAAGQATSVETLWLIFRRGLGSNAWNSAQAVTVHALTDTNANNESVTLTHTATGGDYGTVTKTLTMAVTDTTTMPVDPPGDVMPAFAAATLPAQTYKTRQQMRLQLPAATTGDPPLTYTLTPALPEGLTFTRPTETSDGTITGTPTEQHALTTYTLTATDTDEDTTDPPVSFTLTVELEDLMPSFEGATVDSQVYPRGVQIEPLPLPRATGGNGTLSYTLTPALPEGLTFTRPTDVSDGTITGTPTELQALTTYTLTVRDEDGDPDSITFTIEVKPGIQSRDLALVLAGVGRTLATDAVEILGGRFRSSPASRLQVTLGGQAIRLTAPSRPPSPLAGEGRGEGSFLQGEAPLLQGEPQKAGGSSSGSLQRATGLALGVARALGITLDLPSSSSPSPLAGEGRGEGAQSEGSLLQNNAPLLGRFPTDRSRSTTLSNLFRLQPVSGKDLLARSAFELPLTRTGDDGIPVWTLWGRGSAAGFSGQPEDDFKMDGTLYSGYVGVDYRPQSTVLLGLAVSHSTGDVSYERIGATKAAVDVELTSMLPYAHWQPRPGLGVWGLVGAGWGKINLKAARDPRMHTTGLTSYLVAVGGRQALITWQGIDLAAKTDAFLTTVQSKGKTNLPVARGHAQRMRLLMEGRTPVEVSSVSRLSPYMQLGGRYDSGTAEQGLGAELGGGVAYTRTDLGLSVEAQGRYLLAHEDGAFEDWGASVNVRMDPGVAGQGAYLTVTPVWGQTASGVDQLWGNAAGIPQVAGNATMPAAGWRPHRLEVDMGYGLALADGHGFLTPYGGLALAGPGSSRYRLGSRLALSSSLAVTLEGERAEQPGQEPAHGVSVRVGWQW